jgi:hypothetical protein
MYPPKLVMRQACKLSTPPIHGQLYGGEYVNALLRRLGFDIRVLE